MDVSETPQRRLWLREATHQTPLYCLPSRRTIIIFSNPKAQTSEPATARAGGLGGCIKRETSTARLQGVLLRRRVMVPLEERRCASPHLARIPGAGVPRRLIRSRPPEPRHP